MFSRSTLFTWIGIVALSCLFLMGQEAWPPPDCFDNDGDGYGNPASPGCAFPDLDCDDGNPLVNPGTIEGLDGLPGVCSDTFDNDCDGAVDLDDLDCVPCVDGDGDGYGEQASGNCTYPEEDCNDGNPDVNPGVPEICINGVDDDCDGTADNADEDGDGFIAEACGGTDCDDGNANANPMVTEGPLGNPTCSDLFDNDCDGLVDGLDAGCLDLDQMVTIPGGWFDMGDYFDESDADETPVHAVFIPSFAIDEKEVTNQEYFWCWDEGVCGDPLFNSFTRPTYFLNPTYSTYPVIGVSWDNAQAYCQWAGKRLPTEAEWEYAARGGLEHNRYPWGDTISGTDANYYNSGDPEDNDTNAVGSYAANGYGLFDMAGNVLEWVNDWYSATYYQYCVDNVIQVDPPGPDSGASKVLRGGLFNNQPPALTVSQRQAVPPSLPALNGIRCARD